MACNVSTLVSSLLLLGLTAPDVVNVWAIFDGLLFVLRSDRKFWWVLVNLMDRLQQFHLNLKTQLFVLVRAHGAEAFRKVSDELKNDKDVVMAAVAKDPNAFDDVGQQLATNDKELVLLLVRAQGAEQKKHDREIERKND